MSNYSYVLGLVDDLKIDEMREFPLPENIKLFRKNLTEIGQRSHKKFTTKTKGKKMYVMRINYFSIPQKLAGQ